MDDDLHCNFIEWDWLGLWLVRTMGGVCLGVEVGLWFNYKVVALRVNDRDGIAMAMVEAL